ncbi:P27 family phage terminase small subunit [Stenotrophomonas maltophilia]|uniref:P27 family phage terminase small subunit n=1 Tax=Stenotrophomonas maltophilia TaxID=40324 RepID=UPI0021DA6C86|nr:P27 family phage terminase small subunit [Stenotrophomonas maltophilia]UXY46972.1 P27 family phage terminase small subunit [Stenotrophomonas maltophilia]
MRGRKPTAPALKVIAGTARPDREAPDAPEFDLIDVFPDPPQHLNVNGAAMWNDLGPQLVAAKVLQTVDLYALQQLCYAWQVQVAKQMAGVDITAAEQTALKALMSEFGMTPASRRKVSSGGVEKKPGNKFGALATPGK